MASRALEPVVLRLDSKGSVLHLAECRLLLVRMKQAALRAQKAARAAPRRGVVDGDDAWQSWRGELLRATDPLLLLAAAWEGRGSPEEWTVGRPASSPSRRMDGALAVAELEGEWPARYLEGVAYLSITTGLEPPCQNATTWRQRLAGWKKAMQRARDVVRKRRRAGRRKPTRQRTSR